MRLTKAAVALEICVSLDNTRCAKHATARGAVVEKECRVAQPAVGTYVLPIRAPIHDSDQALGAIPLTRIVVDAFLTAIAACKYVHRSEIQIVN